MQPPPSVRGGGKTNDWGSVTMVKEIVLNKTLRHRVVDLTVMIRILSSIHLPREKNNSRNFVRCLVFSF
jgi:hypothetical protein